MTIGTATPLSRPVYTGPGNYNFSFRIHEEQDIEVQHIDTDGVAVVLNLSIDYTVSIEDPLVGDGGIVTTTYAPTDGFLQLRRNMAIEQQTDWENGDALDMETLERDFDRMVMILQQQDAAIGSKASLTNIKGIWATATDYSADDIVQYPDSNGNYYAAFEGHTSGTFATDLAAGKWSVYIDFSPAVDAAAAASASASAASSSETNAAASESAAGTSASNAATSATNAATSATNAAASETAAGVSATNAGASETAAAVSAAKAEDWAEELEDVEVETGKYSALHHAAKAEEAAASVLANPMTKADAYVTGGTGGTPRESGKMNMEDAVLQRPEIQDYAVKHNSRGSVTGAQTIDLTLGNSTSVTATGNITFTFSNPPASGSFGSIVLTLTNGGAFTITWPTSVDWPGGTAPDLTASGVDILVFFTIDGGTTWHARMSMENSS